MGLPWLPWCGKCATNMSLHRAPGRGTVSCAFHWWDRPQLHQRMGTGTPLMGMGAATSSFSGTALLVQASADFLGGIKVPMFSMISREQAPAALSQEWVLPHWHKPLQILWVELRCLCFP